MEIQKTLQNFGLSGREATIYITLLQLGEGSILDIAKNSTIKRPTIYHAIEQLERKGLLHRGLYGKRVRFIPEPPEKLQQLLQQKEQQLQDALPQLHALQNVPRGTKPSIRYVEGKEAVIAFYTSLFAQMDEKDDIHFFSSIRDLRIHFPEMMKLFDDSAIRWQWKVRELLPNNKATTDYIHQESKSIKKNPRHETRLLPKGLDLFDMEAIILKDSISFISLTDSVYAIAITNQHMTDSFRSIFKAAWIASFSINSPK